MKELITKLMKEEEGASMVEYVLLLALIAVVCIAAVTAVGSKASKQFDTVQGKL